MGTKTDHVMTLSNSIIGVGILAMPFCFQKCGIVLSILLLIIANLITRVSCFYLVKSSILCKRKSFEIMAFYAFGSTGKLLVELSIIGFLMGTCVTYMVVLGDLGPQIVSKILNIDNTTTLRTWVMVLVTIFCVIPLAMLRNVDSLTAVCTASIGFYCCLVIKVIAESRNHFSLDDWMNNVDYWKISGVLQCLPIISMALFCQLQLFEVFESTQNVSPERMNGIVKTAVTICTGVYILVGCFGYITFCTESFSGNILLNFSPTFTNDAIKIGFVLSIAFSFPLVIFPCRVSVNSLLYRRGHSDVAHYIPEHRFRLITISLVLFGMLVGIMIPSVELVIGLVGSTIGIGICVIFPASCFIKISKKDSTEKFFAQILLVFGVILMILGTYANLVALEHKTQQNIVRDKIYKENQLSKEQSNEIENHTTHHKSKLFHQEKVVEIPIEIVPLSPDKNETIKHSYHISPNIQKSFNNDDGKKIVKTLPPSIVQEKIESQPAPPVIPIEKQMPQIASLPPVPVAAVVDINREALQHEDHEIAIENKANQQQLNVVAVNKEPAVVKVDETQELLNAQVNEIKKEFEKQNQETQKLVLEKFDIIAEKVEKMEQKQEKPQIPVDDLKTKKDSHKLTMEKFEEMADRVEKIVEHQEKEKLIEKQQGIVVTIAPVPAANKIADEKLSKKSPTKDTEKLVLKKFEEIAERFERIEQNQEQQKKEIDSVTPTRTNILKKFEKIAEKVMKIEQNQMKDEKNQLPTTISPPLKQLKLSPSIVVPPQEIVQPAKIPTQSLVPAKNTVAPQLILEKFKKIDDYIDKIEQKQKEIEINQPQLVVSDTDKQDAQQLVLEKFEKIAERVEKIEQKQAEQKKIKAAALDTVDEKLEKIVERVEMIEKIQKIEEIGVNKQAPSPPPIVAIDNLPPKTEENQSKKPNINLDPKIVLKKLDEIADKLENTEQLEKNVVKQPPVADEAAAVPVPEIGLDPKVVLEKLDQIAKAVEKIDQKNKVNENPVVKMIIDNQKQNGVVNLTAATVEKKAEKISSKAIPVPVLLLNTSVVGIGEGKVNRKISEDTENPIQAIRRDLLAVKNGENTNEPSLNQTLRKKRSIDNSDCKTVKKHSSEEKLISEENKLIVSPIDNTVNLPALSLGAGIEMMKIIGRK